MIARASLLNVAAALVFMMLSSRHFVPPDEKDTTRAQGCAQIHARVHAGKVYINSTSQGRLQVRSRVADIAGAAHFSQHESYLLRWNADVSTCVGAYVQNGCSIPPPATTPTAFLNCCLRHADRRECRRFTRWVCAAAGLKLLLSSMYNIMTLVPLYPLKRDGNRLPVPHLTLARLYCLSSMILSVAAKSAAAAHACCTSMDMSNTFRDRISFSCFCRRRTVRALGRATAIAGRRLRLLCPPSCWQEAQSHLHSCKPCPAAAASPQQ